VVQPALVLELGRYLLGPWIDTEPLDLIEPAITLRVGQPRSAPRAVVDAHVGASAVVNDEAVLPELRYIRDQMVRAVLWVRVRRALMLNALSHPSAAVCGHHPKVLARPVRSRARGAEAAATRIAHRLVASRCLSPLSPGSRRDRGFHGRKSREICRSQLPLFGPNIQANGLAYHSRTCVRLGGVRGPGGGD